MADKDRDQLLRRPREGNHPVEFDSAIPRTTCEAQNGAVETREAEARAEPKLIGTEAEIPFGKPQTLLRDRKTLAKPPSHPIGKAEAISNRRSQGLVVGSVCLLNGLQKQIESFFDDASKQPDHAEAVQHLTVDVTIPAPLG